MDPLPDDRAEGGGAWAVRPAMQGANDNARPTGSLARIVPFVTIVVPALNEERYIAACLRSLAAQWPAEACEILVMDGGSTDGTTEVVRRMATGLPMIRCRTNPGRTQSAAMNLAADEADPRSAILLRADAHALYPPDFVRRCVAALRQTGAISVVVPMRNRAQPGRGLQRAIAAAQSSRLGNGGSPHRCRATTGDTDHGHHAAFDRRFFLAIGGYDESFTHNEDCEFDHRALRAGGRIWMCAEAPVTYFPRDRLGALAIQYLRHGRGRARTLRKHRLWPRPRQIAPVAAFVACAAGLAAAPVVPGFGAAVLAYPLGCLCWGASQALRRRDPWLLAAGPALIAMHLGWAAGFLHGIAGGAAAAGSSPARHPLRPMRPGTAPEDPRLGAVAGSPATPTQPEPHRLGSAGRR